MSRKFIKTVSLCIVLLVLLLPSSAWARAGGGGHFSGGGGGFHGGGSWGGSFHSSSGHSGGGAIDFWFFLFIVLVFIAVQIAERWGEAKHGTGLTDIGAELSKSREAAALAALHAADQSFDPPAFYARITQAFLKTQAAWCSQNLATIRPFVSDGIFERFLLQIGEQKDLGYRDQMDNLQVTGINLDQVVAGTHFDMAVVRITARAADYEVTLANGTPLHGRAAAESFTEYWSFVRRRGVTTRTTAGLMEGHCPNCGAAVEINEATNCPGCKALLRSGEFDWVLVEITQASEWHERSTAQIPGVAELQALDPDFNVPHLEDRASVMFWRKAMADRLGTIDPLRKIATDQLVLEYGARLSNHAPRTWWGECGVGSVRVNKIILEPAAHQAVVEIHWSGTRFDLLPDGRVQRGDQGTVIRNVLVLVRSATARSNAATAICSAHCPNCGAPERIESSNTCDYCHAVLNDRAHDWVLAAILPYSSPEAQRLLFGVFVHTPEFTAPPPLPQAAAVSLATPSTANLVGWMLKTALVDGDYSVPEQRQITNFATARGMSAAQLDRLTSAARAGTLDLFEPQSAPERHAWVAAVARAALADGKLDRTEIALLRSIVARCGLAEYDLKQILLKERAALLQQRA